MSRCHNRREKSLLSFKCSIVYLCSERVRKSSNENDNRNLFYLSFNVGFVMYKGSLLDIEKLTSQLKRSESARLDTEKLLAKSRQDYASLKETNVKLHHTVKDLNVELKDFKERLTNTNSELCNVDAKTRLYYTALSEIHEKITPLLQHKIEDRNEFEISNVGEEKSRNKKTKSDDGRHQAESSRRSSVGLGQNINEVKEENLSKIKADPISMGIDNDDDDNASDLKCSVETIKKEDVKNETILRNSQSELNGVVENS